MWMGGPIVAVSRKLSHVGLSAAQNEYMGLHWCNRTTVWMRDVFEDMELGYLVEKPTPTYGDNKASILLSEEDIVTSGNQHIQVPYHFNKEVIRDGKTVLKWVPSKQNLADLMTKSVDKVTLQNLLPALLGIDVTLVNLLACEGGYDFPQ